MIVDLSVVGDGQPIVGMDHGLLALLEVNDGKTLVLEVNPLLNVGPLLIRAPVRDHLSHALDQARVLHFRGIKSGDAAHD